jgi:hypothetical protein
MPSNIHWLSSFKVVSFDGRDFVIEKAVSFSAITLSTFKGTQ